MHAWMQTCVGERIHACAKFTTTSPYAMDRSTALAETLDAMTVSSDESFCLLGRPKIDIYIYIVVVHVFQTYILHTRKSEIYTSPMQKPRTTVMNLLLTQSFQYIPETTYFPFYGVHGFVRSLSCCPHLCSIC